MKRIMLSLLVVGLFSGHGTSAVAKGARSVNQAVDEASSSTQVAANSARQSTPARTGVALQSASKVGYKAARDKAQMDYGDAKARCDSMQGDVMRTCMKNAKRARIEALAQAIVQRGRQVGMNGNGSDAMKPPVENK